MKPRDQPEAARLTAALEEYERRHEPLPGIAAAPSRAVLIEQVIESERRNEYIQRLRLVDLAVSGADPHSQGFDPLKAAIVQERRGNFDEACWMVFLYVHFGKHLRAQWRYARDVYGKLDQGGSWGWQEITSDVDGFRKWLTDNQPTLLRRDEPRGFGNHRKYESLDGWSSNGTGEVVATYVDWVISQGGHAELFKNATSGRSPEAAFSTLYRSMDQVQRFGRTARFDYLSLIAKLDLAEIEAGHPYLVNSTGPLTAARMLSGSSQKGPSALSARDLEALLVTLNNHLLIAFDVMEDALCNWQKSPTVFRPFRG
jgi:hypothetical protein